MDIFALLFWGLIILIGIVIFSIPSVLTFLLYRKLKTKGETKKKIGIVIFSITFILTLLLVIKTIISPSGFGPEYDKAEIKQKIGGILICNSVYNADIHDWQYDVSYEYKPANSDSKVKIGSGTYHTRDWKKDEQLIQYKKWTILKTGGWYGYDKIIIGDLKSNKWTEYNFSADNIEKERLWVNSKIHSLLNYCCSESFIDRIENGQIHLHYKFRTSETLTKKYGEKKIIYKIDELSGQPIMTSIE
ncbi:hypothetical protein [Flavobacterium filum]|uniref:hypothetical protein n=1 Tax=Flavobacterium filum TaxID=370974 RepID=UPI0023F007F2|nr:hypothetical protein [Flavobacterium filum]